jgi:hypothetical protein
MRSAAKVLSRFVSVWLLSAPGLVCANGGGLHESFFSSWWGEGKVSLKATVEYDPVLLWSTSIGGKYRLLRVVLENAPDAPPVRFSKQADTFEILADRRIKGILDLESSLGSAAWDSLPAQVRKALVYPAELKPNSARAVYVLVPIDELTTEPTEFSFVIRSLPRPLQIGKKPATKA